MNGRSNKLFNWFTGSSPTDNRTNLEWVVSSPAAEQVKLTVRAQRAGTLRRRLSQACEHECTCLSPDLEALTSLKTARDGI
jgi:hypothetical protein